LLHHEIIIAVAAVGVASVETDSIALLLLACEYVVLRITGCVVLLRNEDVGLLELEGIRSLACGVCLLRGVGLRHIPLIP
jgi:hypothetical protein